MTGVCIGLGEPLSVLDGLLEGSLPTDPPLPRQASAASAGSMDTEDMMFHMDSVSGAAGEKPLAHAQSRLSQTVVPPQRKMEKRLRYYVRIAL